MMMMMRGRRWCWVGGWGGEGGEDDSVDVGEEEDDDVEEEDVEEEGRSQDREAHFVRACAVEMQTDISQEPFCKEIYRKNDRRHLRKHHFVRACAVDMHMDISQGPFCVVFLTGDWPDTDDTTSIEHRALTVSVRTPQCGHVVWGLIVIIGNYQWYIYNNNYDMLSANSLLYLLYLFFDPPFGRICVSWFTKPSNCIYIYISTINPTYIHHKPAISPCSGSQEPWGYFADFAPRFRAQIQTLRWDREDPVDLYGSHKIGWWNVA